MSHRTSRVRGVARRNAAARFHGPCRFALPEKCRDRHRETSTSRIGGSCGYADMRTSLLASVCNTGCLANLAELSGGRAAGPRTTRVFKDMLDASEQRSFPSFHQIYTPGLCSLCLVQCDPSNCSAAEKAMPPSDSAFQPRSRRGLQWLWPFKKRGLVSGIFSWQLSPYIDPLVIVRCPTAA